MILDMSNRSRLTFVLVGLLLFVTGFALLHWHKDWADKGCQLCHVRHLPSLHYGVAVAYGIATVSEQDWNCEHAAHELDTSIRNTSSRSPPSSVSFTL